MLISCFIQTYASIGYCPIYLTSTERCRHLETNPRSKERNVNEINDTLIKIKTQMNSEAKKN